MSFRSYKPPWSTLEAYLRKPRDICDIHAAQEWLDRVHFYDVRGKRVTQSLGGIILRDIDMDIYERLYRWDSRPYQEIFRLGFEARRRGNTQIQTYFNMERYVNRGGRPLDPIRDTNYGFISTTRDPRWSPSIFKGYGEQLENPLYRYEMYLPRGIDVSKTLGGLYHYPNQAEIIFSAGISQEYILSAEPYIVNTDRGYPRLIRANNILYMNRHFDPIFDPQGEIVQNRMLDRQIIEVYPHEDILWQTTNFGEYNTNLMKWLTIEGLWEQEIVRYYGDNKTNAVNRPIIEGFIQREKKE